CVDPKQAACTLDAATSFDIVGLSDATDLRNTLQPRLGAIPGPVGDLAKQTAADADTVVVTVSAAIDGNCVHERPSVAPVASCPTRVAAAFSAMDVLLHTLDGWKPYF